jgi:MtN3 and saliva related transmembrane protein
MACLTNPTPLITATGFAAAFCTTVAYVPQLMRLLHLRSAKELSYPMLSLLSVGLALWLVYGLWVHSNPVIASNACTLALSLSILALKIYFDGLHLKQAHLNKREAALSKREQP